MPCRGEPGDVGSPETESRAGRPDGMNKRQEILTVIVLVLLLASLAFQIHTMYAPFTQYCDWVIPGEVLTCHR